MTAPLERVLGIDPGLNTTGYAVIERAGAKLKLVEAGIVRGKSRGDEGRDMAPLVSSWPALCRPSTPWSG